MVGLSLFISVGGGWHFGRNSTRLWMLTGTSGNPAARLRIWKADRHDRHVALVMISELIIVRPHCGRTLDASGRKRRKPNRQVQPGITFCARVYYKAHYRTYIQAVWLAALSILVAPPNLFNQVVPSHISR